MSLNIHKDMHTLYVIKHTYVIKHVQMHTYVIKHTEAHTYVIKHT